MRFDRTFIAIRERSIFEIFDLSLHVLRDYIQPVFLLLIVGAIPWIAIDLWLTSWLIEDYDYPALFYWIMFLLVVSQAQIGTIFITHYLGQAMFEGRPSIWSSIKGVFSSSMMFFWLHFVLRLIVPTLLFCLILDAYDSEATIGASAILIPGCVFLGLIVRAFRPFVSEILLLEKTPVRKQESGQIHFSKRSASLHGSSSSELFGRSISSFLVAVPLGFSCYALFVTIDSVLNIRSNSETSYVPYYFVCALWMVAGFMAIIRFLSYIDIRIRQEGWAVELKMRAEGSRLAGVD